MRQKAAHQKREQFWSKWRFFILVGAMVAWNGRHTQGLTSLFSFPLERPKAEALGYLQATASARQRQLQKAKADPYGMTTKMSGQRQQQRQA
jgi:hypothetical protein